MKQATAEELQEAWDKLSQEERERFIEEHLEEIAELLEKGKLN